MPPFPSRLPCLSLLLLYPYCITTWGVCQEVFYFFLRTSPAGFADPFGLSLLLTSLTLYHISGGLSRGFLHFFSISSDYSPRSPTAWRLYPSPLDTNSIPHPTPDCNRQDAQNWDFYFFDICATFLLTNCWRCVIMEISRRAVVGGALKMPLIVD